MGQSNRLVDQAREARDAKREKASGAQSKVFLSRVKKEARCDRSGVCIVQYVYGEVLLPGHRGSSISVRAAVHAHEIFTAVLVLYRSKGANRGATRNPVCRSGFGKTVSS